MFKCYLDDSGTSGLPVVTLAGFVASESQWKILEPQIDAVMNRYGVSIFHAKEFHDTKPPFSGWSKIKKRTFAEEIFIITQKRIFGLSCTLRKTDYVKYQRETGRLASMSPIAICFAAIMMRFFTDPALSVGTKAAGVSFLVEAGNKNNAEIAAYFQKMRTNKVFDGKLNSIEFISKGNCRAIQIADLFAFYSRRYMRDHNRFSGRLALPLPPVLQIIQRHNPIWQVGGYGAPEAVGSTEQMTDIAALMSSIQNRSR